MSTILGRAAAWRPVRHRQNKAVVVSKRFMVLGLGCELLPNGHTSSKQENLQWVRCVRCVRYRVRRSRSRFSPPFRPRRRKNPVSYLVGNQPLASGLKNFRKIFPKSVDAGRSASLSSPSRREVRRASETGSCGAPAMAARARLRIHSQLRKFFDSVARKGGWRADRKRHRSRRRTAWARARVTRGPDSSGRNEKIDLCAAR